MQPPAWDEFPSCRQSLTLGQEITVGVRDATEGFFIGHLTTYSATKTVDVPPTVYHVFAVPIRGSASRQLGIIAGN